MKVLYAYRYGILGGVCTQLINRLGVMSSKVGIEAHLAFSQDYGISATLGDYPHVYFERNSAELRKIATEGDFDAAVVIDTPEYFEALNDIPGTALITEVHTTTEKGLGYLSDIRWSTRGYIVPSIYSRRILRDRFGIGERQPVHVVPNSLQASLFPRVVVSVGSDRPVFGWVGKLDDHKNWRGFLDVALRVRDSGLDADFWLIGGETAPSAVEGELVDEIEARGLGSHCRWFPRIEYEAMHRVYAAVRQSGGAMIVTSIDESFGMSVLEALMSGCPVIASRVGALPELAPDKSYLRLYEVHHSDEAAKLAVELSDPEVGNPLRRELEEDWAWLASSYSQQNVTNRYLEILRELSA